MHDICTYKNDAPQGTTPRPAGESQAPALDSRSDEEVSLPKLRRQRVFQAFSVPGAEKLQKLTSVGPWGYIFSNNCSKSNDNP